MDIDNHKGFVWEAVQTIIKDYDNLALTDLYANMIVALKQGTSFFLVRNEHEGSRRLSILQSTVSVGLYQ
jgi:hypothetical protein